MIIFVVVSVFKEIVSVCELFFDNVPLYSSCDGIVIQQDKEKKFVPQLVIQWLKKPNKIPKNTLETIC